MTLKSEGFEDCFFRVLALFHRPERKKICQNQSSPKEDHSCRRLNPARIGGARVAGQNRSRFATARTRAPALRPSRWKSPKPGPLRGADASTRRTRRFATAATPGCDRGWAAPDERSRHAHFFRKRFCGSATLSTERSSPLLGLRSRAVLRRRARRFTALPA